MDLINLVLLSSSSSALLSPSLFSPFSPLCSPPHFSPFFSPPVVSPPPVFSPSPLPFSSSSFPPPHRLLFLLPDFCSTPLPNPPLSTKLPSERSPSLAASWHICQLHVVSPGRLARLPEGSARLGAAQRCCVPIRPELLRPRNSIITSDNGLLAGGAQSGTI